jgi:hypothetical protein
MFKVALLLPLKGLTVSQLGTLLTTQALQVLVTLAVALPAVAATEKVVGLTASVVATCPACVTEMVCVMLHPLTVMVALRVSVVELASYVKLRVPLLAPVPGLTVSHVGAPLTAQAAQLLLTVAVALPAVAGQLKVVGDTVRVVTAVASCDTLID